MTRTVSATEARVHFGELFRAVAEAGETVVVERARHQRVVVLPMAEYERLQAVAREDPRRTGLARAASVAQAIGARARSRPLPAPEDVIREGREQRDAALDEALR
ncbi:type II toxin-antitoxin system Phd/YefM family antitoxin [Myxococcota bacterium]|nr:type II toxin-antitoxin system Phd/YefM family antitoxin [Myxococcota bacterium]